MSRAPSAVSSRVRAPASSEVIRWVLSWSSLPSSHADAGTPDGTVAPEVTSDALGGLLRVPSGFARLLVGDPALPPELRLLLAATLRVRLGEQRPDRSRTAGRVHGDEDEVRAVHVPDRPGERVLGLDPDPAFHRGPADVVHACLEDDHLTDVDRFEE